MQQQELVCFHLGWIGLFFVCLFVLWLLLLRNMFLLNVPVAAFQHISYENVIISRVSTLNFFLFMFTLVYGLFFKNDSSGKENKLYIFVHFLF